jgi:RNA polymerase sigma factor for flagellar operon FliA
MVGLLDALEKFDPKRGIAFEAYARIRVRGAIQDELRNLDHLTRTMRRRTRTVRESHKALSKDAEGPVSETDLAEHSGLTVEDVHQSLSQSKPPQALDPGALDAVMDLPLWKLPEGQLDRMELEERLELLSRALAELPERNRLVLGLYYEAELTLKEIGDVLGVTQSRVSQILRKTGEILRARLDESGGGTS